MPNEVTVESLKENIRKLYGWIGAQSSACKACGMPIYWIKTKNNKQMPVTDEAISHFANCPQAANFRHSDAMKTEDVKPIE
jgi:hypothetical protein